MDSKVISSSYEPTFNPLAAGGYFWLVVVSERTYGNTLTDTNPQSRHKQLWVTAIDANPQPGQDPSHPAFWLPGQETANSNMRGEWALSPCKPMGSDCSAGYECCDGFCSDDGTGHFTCSTSKGCSHESEACTTAADCCTVGANCTGFSGRFELIHSEQSLRSTSDAVRGPTGLRATTSSEQGPLCSAPVIEPHRT